MTTTTCAHCGSEFEVKPYRLKRNKSGLLFCSWECRMADGSTLEGRPTTLPPLTCPVCGVKFHRKPAERQEVNYCSYACAAKGTGNLRPAPKGERRSPATEFRSGQTPHNRLPVGSERIRKRPGRKDKRAFVKVAEPNVWRLRAHLAYEQAHGPIPQGKVVHHINHDPLDDRPENLVALSRAEHLNEHRHDW